MKDSGEVMQVTPTCAPREDLLSKIYEVIDELNETLPEGQRLTKSPGTLLFGGGANLESLGLVRLVMLVEQKVLDETGRIVTLVDEKAMSQSRSPFRTVGTLADYLVVLLGEESDV
jgi:hypothetical protein